MERRWLPVLVTAGMAALLAVAAVFTADRAGCAEPGSYVRTPSGVTLVGGCLNSADLPVSPPQPIHHPSLPNPPSGD
jgi:hypothetical protein